MDLNFIKTQTFPDKNIKIKKKITFDLTDPIEAG